MQNLRIVGAHSVNFLPTQTVKTLNYIANRSAPSELIKVFPSSQLSSIRSLTCKNLKVSTKGIKSQRLPWSAFRYKYQNVFYRHLWNSDTPVNGNSGAENNISHEPVSRNSHDNSLAKECLQESSELGDILKHLYEENDIGKSNLGSENTKGKC